MRESTPIRLVPREALRGEANAAPHADPGSLAALTPEKLHAILDNPLNGGDDEIVQVIGTRGGSVVGRLDLIEGRIDVDGRPVRCTWTSNLYVPVDARSSLLGLTMLLKAQQLHDVIGVCGVSQMALPLYQGMKWRHFRLPRFVLLCRSRAVVERYLPNRLVAAPLGLLADAGLAVLRWLVAGAVAVLAPGLRVEPLAAATPELDEALARNMPGVATHRSARFIDWLLTHSFDADPRNRRGLFAVRCRDGRLVAYFVAKSRFYPVATQREFRNLQLGSLQDFRIFAPDVVSPLQLVLLATRAIAAWRPDAIEVCIPPDCGRPRLRPWGFLPAGTLHLLVKCGGQPRLATARDDEWVIRPADGDNFFV